MRIGISPNGKEFDAEQAYRDGLISWKERVFAIQRKEEKEAKKRYEKEFGKK